ncbi:MAG: hypothetical protein ACE5GC_00050 [Acidimicrobiia bacterium]
MIEITGGAGPRETAAIVAAVGLLLEEESAAWATPDPPSRQSAWVLAWRPREKPAPLPSSAYDATSWGDEDAGDERARP